MWCVEARYQYSICPSKSTQMYKRGNESSRRLFMIPYSIFIKLIVKMIHHLLQDRIQGRQNIFWFHLTRCNCLLHKLKANDSIIFLSVAGISFSLWYMATKRDSVVLRVTIRQAFAIYTYILQNSLKWESIRLIPKTGLSLQPSLILWHVMLHICVYIGGYHRKRACLLSKMLRSVNRYFWQSTPF